LTDTEEQMDDFLSIMHTFDSIWWAIPEHNNHYCNHQPHALYTAL